WRTFTSSAAGSATHGEVVAARPTYSISEDPASTITPSTGAIHTGNPAPTLIAPYATPTRAIASASITTLRIGTARVRHFEPMIVMMNTARRIRQIRRARSDDGLETGWRSHNNFPGWQSPHVSSTNGVGSASP